jgi:hypothetical protein
MQGPVWLEPKVKQGLRQTAAIGAILASFGARLPLSFARNGRIIKEL